MKIQKLSEGNSCSFLPWYCWNTLESWLHDFLCQEYGDFLFSNMISVCLQQWLLTLWRKVWWECFRNAFFWCANPWFWCYSMGSCLNFLLGWQIYFPGVIIHLFFSNGVHHSNVVFFELSLYLTLTIWGASICKMLLGRCRPIKG